MNPTTLLSGLGAAITADPSLGGASTSGRESAPGSGDLFLALVTGLLQGDLTTSTPVADPAAAAPEMAEPEAADDIEAAPALPLVTTAGLLPLPAAATVAEPEVADEPVTDDQQVDPAAVPTLPVAPAMSPLVLPLPAVAAVPTGVAADGTTIDVPSVGAATTDAPPAGPATGDSAQSAPDGGSDQPSHGSSPTPTAPRTEAPLDAVPTQAATPATTPAPTPATSVQLVAPAAAPAAVATPTAAPELRRVADQVFPEVVRASATSGTSRVVVKLNPEALGEVRVVLTQRGGELEVSLAAGSDARRALAEGAPELRRLLESVGRADSRILIRDLPVGTPPAGAQPGPAPAPSTPTAVSTDLAGGSWSGAGSPGGEPAPDRDDSRHHPGSSTATDGIPRATPASRPITTARRDHVGLDLSM